MKSHWPTYRFLCWAGLMLLGTSLWAQVEVRAQLDSNQILIGDQVNLQLAVRHAPGISVFPPDLSQLDTIKSIELIDVGRWDTLEQGAQILLQQQILLTAFDSGAYYIPAIPIRYQSNGQNSQTYTNQLLLEVTNVPIDSVYLAPIKGNIYEELTLEDVLPYLIGLALILVLGSIAYYLYRRRQLQTAPPPPEIVIPAHEVALSKLAELKAEKLWQKGEVKEYLSQLTYIIREYLENRYSIQALELTTDEIVEQLRSSDITPNWTQHFQEMLQMADLVKFAKAIPPANIHDQLMTKAETFVRETKAIPIVEEEAQDKEASDPISSPQTNT
ncbi:MAG: hypothetical protein AAFP19_14550 [Bacteroidota bacterium]